MSNYDLEAQNGDNSTEVARSLIEELAEQLKKLSRETIKVGTKRDSIEVRSNIETGLIPNCNSIRHKIEKESWGSSSQDRVIQGSKLYNDFVMLKGELQKLQKDYRESKSKHPLKNDNGSATKVVRGDPESNYLSIQVNEQTPLLQEEEQQERQLLQQQQQQQQQQLWQESNANQDEVDFHTIILRERSQQVTRIHSAVQEVNAIFRQLGSLVNQQGDQVDEVDANIGQLANNMQKANSQLHRADQNQRKKNRCGLITLTIMVIFVLIVTLLVLS
ncbi:hypothetical protein ZYGR_0H02430 [Zygosaccharomyces rouxii]|uniref:ZYRO0B09614p n=2 Tax=Zygosaccharomyces rouxii TaxID=4956 RepID=C5DRM3_ZYGRC|nr:uncharacterized protein ZYRO0B09614g [Zygosaccharomyces rouxii]KAH9200032.1 t-SNARE [Zygosaccharomyces rouxii]GAV47401.1 hypothetical protein ZYGR_0H02430 [Zygosaccharomyces rouxii]CAR26434.1 ZYRO0B09614p [Zygosaccharomyces rouxii]